MLDNLLHWSGVSLAGRKRQRFHRRALTPPTSYMASFTRSMPTSSMASFTRSMPTSSMASFASLVPASPTVSFTRSPPSSSMASSGARQYRAECYRAECYRIAWSSRDTPRCRFDRALNQGTQVGTHERPGFSATAAITHQSRLPPSRYRRTVPLLSPSFCSAHLPIIAFWEGDHGSPLSGGAGEAGPGDKGLHSRGTRRRAQQPGRNVA